MGKNPAGKSGRYECEVAKLKRGGGDDELPGGHWLELFPFPRELLLLLKKGGEKSDGQRQSTTGRYV